MQDFEDILEMFEDYKRDPRPMDQEPRNNYFGGGKVLQLLKNFNKTGAVKGLEEKLIKQYKSEGMDFIEAIKKAQTEANGVRYEGRMKIIDNAMKETNVMSDDYVDLLDMKIKLEDPDFAKQYVNFSENLKNKTRSRYDSDWAEANFGEEYGTKLDQVRVREINESIDPNITERSLVDDIDDMNIANTDEFFGRKKNATGGLQRNMYSVGKLVKEGAEELASKIFKPKPKPELNIPKPSILRREAAPLDLSQINEISKNKEFEQAWKNYKISIRKVGRRKYNKDQFFEMWARENMAQGGRIGFYNGTDPEIIKRIKDYGIQKYNKLNNQQKYSVRTARTSTTPYSFKFGKNKFDATVTGLTKKGANNLQELLNVINEKDLTPQKWFGKTSKASGNKAKGGLDLLARDVVKYLKGEEVKGINKTIFDTIDIKTLIGDKADIVSKIDGISFRQAAGTTASAISQPEASFNAVKLVNKEFMLDPDISIDELAERLYGKGASNSVRALKDTQRDIAKYIDVLKTGTRANVQIPDFKYPSPKKAFEILDSIEDRSSSFGFQEGVIRELKFNVRDNLLNFKKGSTLSLRRMLSEVIADSDFAGNVIDESVGLSASYDKLPGYTEATQILPNELNQRKGAEIDKPFNKIINKVYNGTATPEEIKEYNSSARKFMKETKVDVPIIRSTITGDDLKNPNKFIRNLSSFSEEAQKNILELAKNKNFVIETGASPLTLKEGKATKETAKDFFNQNKKKINILNSFCDRKGFSGAGPVGVVTCSMDEIQGNLNKQVKAAEKSIKASKDGKLPRKFGKLKALGKMVFGLAEIPIEALLMLPEIAAGNPDAAARKSIIKYAIPDDVIEFFSGVKDGGKFNLEELKEKNPETYQYLKDKRDKENFTKAEATLDELQPFLMKAYDNKTLDQIDPDILKRYNDALEERESILKGYQEYGYYSDDQTKTPLTGKIATKEYLRNKVKTDFENFTNKRDKKQTLEYEQSGLGFKKDPNQKKIKYEDIYKAPTDLKSFINQKGELGKDTMFQYGVRDEASNIGESDIFDKYVGDYAGVETPGIGPIKYKKDGKDEYYTKYGITDVRDAFSSLPKDYAGQLAALEKEELKQGLKRKGKFNTRSFKDLLDSQQMNTDELYANGGLAGLMKKYYD